MDSSQLNQAQDVLDKTPIEELLHIPQTQRPSIESDVESLQLQLKKLERKLEQTPSRKRCLQLENS